MCPKCESRDIEVYDRFTGGLSILLLSPAVFVLFSVLGANATITVMLLILMIITGIIGLMLTASSGRKIFTCKSCYNQWKG